MLRKKLNFTLSRKDRKYDRKLDTLGISYKRQAEIPVYYETVKLELGFRADIIVSEKVIVEIKSVELIATTVPKIVLTYLKATNIKLGAGVL